MTTRHQNPSRPSSTEARSNRPPYKISYDVWAHAPYNFVQLPEQVIPAIQPIPDHDTYISPKPDCKLFTGRIEYEFETKSPTYTRGMLKAKEYNLSQSGENTSQEDEDAVKANSEFFSTQPEKKIGNLPEPSIPGSTMRGMIRAIIEVITYGRMRWVGNDSAVTFRAVAAQNRNPLKLAYNNLMGMNGSQVRAGYLCKQVDPKTNELVWKISPVGMFRNEGLSFRRCFVRVNAETASKAITDLPDIGDVNNYHPGFFPIWFKLGTKQIQQGQQPVTDIVASDIRLRDENATSAPEGFNRMGTLVCSGNMMETGRPGQTTRRAYHAVIMAKSDVNPILIPNWAIRDYLKTLTPFQKSDLYAWHLPGPHQGNIAKAYPVIDRLTAAQKQAYRQQKKELAVHCSSMGCLAEGAPVFFISEILSTGEEQVLWFGHDPFFRVPAIIGQDDARHAATPLDFIPEQIRQSTLPDFSDAMFGWVKEDFGPQNSRAGRVFFKDAVFSGSNYPDGKIWYNEGDEITPHVLGSPKPSCFQHYLEQDNPNTQQNLVHYGKQNPPRTRIRGHKFYWARGNVQNETIEANDQERQHPKQLVRIRPLKAGVRFKSCVYFENLYREELGVLLWALNLPGGDHCHRLGMGKPLGMGVIKIKPESVKVYTSDRQVRYKKLFSDSGKEWNTVETLENVDDLIKKMKDYIASKAANNIPFDRLDRIQELLALLKWREGETMWLEWTRYMEIEKSLDNNFKLNEYKEFPVLPDPKEVERTYRARRPVSPGQGQDQDRRNRR